VLYLRRLVVVLSCSILARPVGAGVVAVIAEMFVHKFDEFLSTDREVVARSEVWIADGRFVSCLDCCSFLLRGLIEAAVSLSYTTGARESFRWRASEGRRSSEKIDEKIE
jgi:hypothetical protein